MAQAANDLTANFLGGKAVHTNLSKSLAISGTDSAKFQSVGALRAALTSYGYTSQQLDIMTKNDMVYALRLKLGTF